MVFGVDGFFFLITCDIRDENSTRCFTTSHGGAIS